VQAENAQGGERDAAADEQPFPAEQEAEHQVEEGWQQEGWQEGWQEGYEDYTYAEPAQYDGGYVDGGYQDGAYCEDW